MAKRIGFTVKEQMVGLAGACFWYWNSFHSFLESSGVPSSLHRRYPKETFNKYDVMRNILAVLEDRGEVDTINSLIPNFYRLRMPSIATISTRTRQNDSFRNSVVLCWVRSDRGSDPRSNSERKHRSDYEQSLEDSKAKMEGLSELNGRFLGLTLATELTPQQRGFKLETLLFDLLHFAEFEYTKPYRTQDGEQIDGHFKYEKFDYLVEAKWIAGLVKQKDLSIFDGKIRGKAQSTRGLFLAAEGFDDNAVNKFSGTHPELF